MNRQQLISVFWVVWLMAACCLHHMQMHAGTLSQKGFIESSEFFSSNLRHCAKGLRNECHDWLFWRSRDKDILADHVEQRTEIHYNDDKCSKQVCNLFVC